MVLISLRESDHAEQLGERASAVRLGAAVLDRAALKQCFEVGEKIVPEGVQGMENLSLHHASRFLVVPFRRRLSIDVIADLGQHPPFAHLLDSIDEHPEIVEKSEIFPDLAGIRSEDIDQSVPRIFKPRGHGRFLHLQGSVQIVVLAPSGILALRAIHGFHRILLFEGTKNLKSFYLFCQGKEY